MSSSLASSSSSSTRVLTLEGGCNFRDIGGYQTSGGQCVKWGQVFRAGVLSYVTDADHASLSSLRVRTICDLRRAEERRNEPSRWLDTTARTLTWDDESDPQTLRKYAAQRPPTAEGMFDAMLDLYGGLPMRMSNRLRGLLSCIAEGQVPIIIHCAAGKDRTGVAIAVLLSSLGVPKQTVIEDYLLTNKVSNFEAFIRGREDAQLGLADLKHPLLAMPEGIRRVVFSAHTDFLCAAFAAIDQHGGMDAYLEKVVGIDTLMRERLRAILLE